MNKFYVYQHKTKDTNEIFYIGKGTGFRAHSKVRNKYWHKIASKHAYIVEFVKTNMNEKEALKLELELTKSLKPRANICLGGGGVSGYKHSPENLKKMRDFVNSEEFKQRMKKLKTGKLSKNPNKPRKPVICVNSGKQYESVTRAARDLNLSTSFICRVLRGKLKHAKGFRFEYVGVPSCQ
jgi:hypothetical protein